MTFFLGWQLSNLECVYIYTVRHALARVINVAVLNSHNSFGLALIKCRRCLTVCKSYLQGLFASFPCAYTIPKSIPKPIPKNKIPHYGRGCPAARYSSYHSGRVSCMSHAVKISFSRSSLEVPAITCILAGCLKIHAVAIAVLETPY